MSKYGLVGKLQARNGKGEELAAILLAAAALMKRVAGCQIYLINQEAGNPDALWVLEVWDSLAAHDTSLDDPKVRELISRALPLLAGRPEGGISLEVLGGKGFPD